MLARNNMKLKSALLQLVIYEAYLPCYIFIITSVIFFTGILSFMRFLFESR